MRALGAAAAVALLLTGTASAAVVEFSLAPRAPASLPSSTVPNAGGSLRLPEAFTTPPAQRRQLVFPALQSLWQRAGSAYGIPWRVLASINRIETNFGQNMGPSSAGAVGWMQFMPETWLRWGMDGDGDGVADPWQPEDAIFAAARYLAAAGGATDLPRAIFAYNHAQWYVDEVLEGARHYGDGGHVAADAASVAFTSAAASAEVDAAETAVADAEARLAKARRAEQRLARREAHLLAQAARSELFSEQLAVERDAAQTGWLRDDAAAETQRLVSELADAREALERARQGALAAAVSPSTAGLALGAAGDYVFPVGGGAETVSVSHSHHDYPAADIAAPQGAPVYAHTAGAVIAGWPQGNGACGIGFTFRAGDGREWTYCHLSQLDPAVTAGTALAAGAAVGLVGSTGHSTGPHLHLQLQPAASYPQEEAWFRAFVGTAFSWQDAPHEHSAPVFAVAPEPAISFSRFDS